MLVTRAELCDSPRLGCQAWVYAGQLGDGFGDVLGPRGLSLVSASPPLTPSFHLRYSPIQSPDPLAYASDLSWLFPVPLEYSKENTQRGVTGKVAQCSQMSPLLS